MNAFMKGLLNYCTICAIVSAVALAFCEIRKRIVYTKEERIQNKKDFNYQFSRDPSMQLLAHLLGAHTAIETVNCVLILGTFIPGVNLWMWKTMFSPIKKEDK